MKFLYELYLDSQHKVVTDIYLMLPDVYLHNCLNMQLKHVCALLYNSEVNIDCTKYVCREMTPSAYRLVPFKVLLSLCYLVCHWACFFPDK